MTVPDDPPDEPRGGPRDEPRAWVVRRVDDNGNVFEVERFSHRGGADVLAAELSARGHKQTYWVECVG